MGGFLKNLIKRLNQPITISNSKISALGILCLALTVLYFLLVYPLVVLERDYSENAENSRFKLGHLKQVAGEREALTERLEKIKALAKKNEAFLPTETAALATAELQNRMKQAVSDAGGELSSTQVIPEHAEENAIKVGIKVRLAASTPMLRQILHNFEAGKPYLFIDNLNIRPIRIPRNPNDKNQHFDDRLSVDFDVIGYMQAP